MEKTLLVGLDAACWEYLDPLLQAGRLPTLQKLINEGAWGVLNSTMPAWTPTAWSSIVTAKNPGKHGVYDMLWHKPGDYELRPVNANIRRGSPFWKYLNDAGIRVGLVNVPFVHPPAPVEGFMVCGFGTPDLVRDLTWPSEALAWIEERFGTYVPVVPTELLRSGKVQEILATETSHQDRLVGIANGLADQYAVDVLVINLMLTDHANHKMPDMALVQEAYVQSDADLATLLDTFKPDNVLLISDHGSSRLKGDFLLNVWLREHGYCVYLENNPAQRQSALHWVLKQWFNDHFGLTGRLEWFLRRSLRVILPRLPKSLQKRFWAMVEKAIPFAEAHIQYSKKLDYSRTAVFPSSLYSGLLYLNLSSRESNGMISAEERKTLIAKLKAELSQIKDPDTGTPLFANVFSSDELFHGAATVSAPDIVLDAFRSQWNIRTLQPAPFKGKQHSRYFVTFDQKRDYGWHSPDGVFVFTGPAFQPGHVEKPGLLMDIPATLLYLYDIPLPEDWDGQVLLDLLTPDLRARPIRTQAGDQESEGVAETNLSDAEADALVEHLRALGYL